MAIETIVNGTSIIIQESVDYGWVGVTIASIVAVITLIGIIWSNLLTKKSLEITQEQLKEMKNSNKILKTDLIGKYKPEWEIIGHTKILNEPDPLNPTFTFEIHNKGRNAIQKMEILGTQHYPNKSNIFNLETFLKDTPHLFSIYKSPHAMLKNTKTKPIRYIPTGNDPDVYIILWFKYEFLGGEKTEIIHLFHYVNWVYDSHSSYTESLLNEMREKIDSNKKIHD